MKILFIAGGWSNERPVSLTAAPNIRQALENLGHEVSFLDPGTDFDSLYEKAREADFAYLNLHGEGGEDGLIQAVLERAGTPYQGSGPEASFLALHKAASKQVFKANGIPTPEWEFLPVEPEASWIPSFHGPWFVKPVNGGSSLDMALAETVGELREAMDVIFSKGQGVLVERTISGSELTCAVVDGEPLPVILIKPKGDSIFFDYENKYAADGAEEICPAPIDDALRDRIQELAAKVHDVLGLSGYSRADFLVDEDGNPWCLEVNTLPGMTPTSLLPRAAAAMGMDFIQLIGKLVEVGLKNSGK